MILYGANKDRHVIIGLKTIYYVNNKPILISDKPDMDIISKWIKDPKGAIK